MNRTSGVHGQGGSNLTSTENDFFLYVKSENQL